MGGVAVNLNKTDSVDFFLSQGFRIITVSLLKSLLLVGYLSEPNSESFDKVKGLRVR